MKLNGMNQGMAYSMPLIGLLFVLTSSTGHAGSMGAAQVGESQRFYVGVFGGGGESSKLRVIQYGTAFYTEAQGGPLAVNAFGRANSRSVDFIGGQVGYQWAELFLNPLHSEWGITPAIELEGSYLGKSKLTSHDMNNNTARLPEHAFLVKYPMKAGVFLTNTVINLDLPNQSRFHPYVGGGIGGAVVSISNAAATQLSPAEPGVNHYNSNTKDTDATFAAQVKAGLNVTLYNNLSLFGEYRWLYLSNTSYTFGSTVYPGHVPTSNWLVKIDPQKYNMGAVGIRYSV